MCQYWINMFQNLSWTFVSQFGALRTLIDSNTHYIIINIELELSTSKVQSAGRLINADLA